MAQPPRNAARVATLLALALIAASARSAEAHFPILIADRPWAKKGDAVRIDYAFGHPFEAAHVDVARPAKVGVRTPSGKTIALDDGLSEATIGSGDAKATAWQLEYRPEERGDHVLHLEAAPREHEGRAVVDHVKLILHVQAQRGWDAVVGHPVELVPLTRPYGIPVGASFRARVLVHGKPLGGLDVAVEARNAIAPDPLPPDELITRIEKTDDLGVFATTLDRPGWWLLAVDHESEGTHTRGCLWVHVGAPR